jgi:hypothetical protein
VPFAGVTSDGRLLTWGWGGAVGSGGFLSPGVCYASMCCA